MKISAYIVTLNEEKRLPKTLEAVKQVADEIIIVDSGSTDKTEEIAKTYNCKFIFHKWISYCDQKYFAQEQCKNDFVLMIDADEVLSNNLINEINKLKENCMYDAYRIKIVDMPPYSTKPNFFVRKFNPVRLYNRKVCTIPKDLMNKDRVDISNTNKIGQLKNYILHYCFLTIFDSVNKYNLHSSELVNTAIKENKHYGKIRLITEFPRQFFKYYFIQRYFAYGSFGFIRAMVLSYFRFLKIAKWVEYDLSKSKNKK